MHTRTTLKNWAVASAVAAMLAAAAPSAFAQGPATPSGPATPPTSTPPGPTSVTPDNSNTTTPSATPSATPVPADAPAAGTASPPMSGSMSTPMSNADMTAAAAVPPNFPTDYALLSNRYFDATDLEQARARGLSESQIATVVKISKETGYPFKYISGAVERGATFPSLAGEYGLKLSDVYDNQKEMQQVSDYTTLHKAAAMLGKGSSTMSMPMDSSSAPSSSTMTPPMATSTTMTPAPSTATLDIVDTAMAAKNLTTLVKALQIAGLVETLKGAGPFTVFAPTDKAFAKLPAGALDALEADPAKLKTVLTYHVIPAAVSASDAMSMTSPTSPPTVEGSTLQITKGRRGRLKVNDATVVKADIQASNGVIHIIDSVLMPPDASAATAPTPDATATPPAAPAPTDATPPAAPATPGTTAPAAPAAPGTMAPGTATPTTPGQ